MRLDEVEIISLWLQTKSTSKLDRSKVHFANAQTCAVRARTAPIMSIVREEQALISIPFMCCVSKSDQTPELQRADELY
jgi:hypothetical protein